MSRTATWSAGAPRASPAGRTRRGLRLEPPGPGHALAAAGRSCDRLGRARTFLAPHRARGRLDAHAAPARVGDGRRGHDQAAGRRPSAAAAGRDRARPPHRLAAPGPAAGAAGPSSGRLESRGPARGPGASGARARSPRVPSCGSPRSRSRRSCPRSPCTVRLCRRAHLSRYSHGYSPTRLGARWLNPVRTGVEARYLAERIVVGPEGSTVGR